MDNGAKPRVDGESHAVRDGVVDVDELHAELAGLDGHAAFHRDDLRRLQQAVFFKLQTDEARRQARAVDGDVHLLEDIRHRADVILVSVRDEKAADAVLVLDKIAHIGDHAVDAVHIVAGKGHAAVNYDDLAAVFVNGHILADLIETAKRNNF